MFNTALTLSDLMLLAKGAGMTLAVTFFAVTGGTLMGLAFGVIRAQIAHGPPCHLPLCWTFSVRFPCCFNWLSPMRFRRLPG